MAKATRVRAQLLAAHAGALRDLQREPILGRESLVAAAAVLTAMERVCQQVRRFNGGITPEFTSLAAPQLAKWCADRLISMLRANPSARVALEGRLIREADAALRRAYDFSFVEGHTRDVLSGRLACEYRKNLFTFTDAPGERYSDPAVLMVRHRRDALDNTDGALLRVSALEDEWNRVIGLLDQIVRNDEASREATGRLEVLVSRSLRAKPKAYLSIATNIGPYTLNDALRSWHRLATKARVHDLISLRLGRSDNSLLLRLTGFEIRTLLADPSWDDAGVEAFLSDFSFEPTELRPSYVHETPLLRAGSEYLLAPNFLTTANAEECTLRTWSKKRSGRYGSVVAASKRHLESEWAGRMRRPGWYAASSRKLKDSAGRDAGDVDICVYSPSERHLLLVQLKWLLSPDDAREVDSAERELADACRQARRAEEMLGEMPAPLHILFPGEAKPDWQLDRISNIVLGRGHAFLSEKARLGVDVFPEELAERFLRTYGGPLAIADASGS